MCIFKVQPLLVNILVAYDRGKISWSTVDICIVIEIAYLILIYCKVEISPSTV